MIPWWAAVLGVLAVLGGGLLGVRAYQQRFAPPPEVPRKLIHVLMGLVALSFPWVFAQAWPVVLLGVLATAAMLAVRLVGPLRHGVGSVLHSVDRASLGEVCFPIGVATVFALSFGHPVLYVVPVLLLTLADAVAAIVGIRFGHREYTTAETPKTVEGSLAFLIAAVLLVAVPLATLGGVGWAVAVPVGVLLGLLMMIFEAIAWRGLDNLFVPLAAYVFLHEQVTKAPLWLWGQVACVLVLLALGIWYRRRTTLTDNGVLAAALAAYTLWVLGGWQWVIAPLIFFFTYALVTPLTRAQRQRITDARAVMSYSAPALWWMFVAASSGQTNLLYAAQTSFAAGLAMFGVVHLRRNRPAAGPIAIGLIVVRDWMLMFLPWLAIVWISRNSLLLAGIALVLTALSVAAILVVQRMASRPLTEPRRWFAQSVIAFGASFLAASAWGFVTLWAR